MRTLREYLFRARQEIATFKLLVQPPDVPHAVTSVGHLALPAPHRAVAQVAGTRFAADLERIADRILAHQFPIFGFEVDTGPDIDWRRDYTRGVVSGTGYGKTMPFLDVGRVGDHKIVWELNRHQHLVVLAQAYCLTGRDEFVREVERQLDSWWIANPYLRGINWSSALEVAFRALSWLWVVHLLDQSLQPPVRQRLVTELYRHGRYLEHNLSTYFSPNTHLLIEAVALHALGVLYGSVTDRWRQRGDATVQSAVASQICADGSHFEQSAYYHVYALDSLAFHHIIGGTVSTTVIGRMADYLAALMGPSRRLPFFGDDDGGRFFHPYGARDVFGRATLATCAQVLERADLPYAPEDLHEQASWWLGGGRKVEAVPSAAFRSRLFPDAGVAVMVADGLQIVADGGPLGAGSAGHSHSDTLSLVVRLREREILIDPGTYTYVGDQTRRDWFRGSAAHNTVRIDGHNQATMDGPFRWTSVPSVDVDEWSSTEERDRFRATCRYRGLVHARTILFMKPGAIVITDTLEGPPGEHVVEQFWHFGEEAALHPDRSIRIGAAVRMRFSGGLVEFWDGGDEFGWRSPVFGEQKPAPVARVSLRTELPVTLQAILDLLDGDTAVDFDDAMVDALARHNIRR